MRQHTQAWHQLVKHQNFIKFLIFIEYISIELQEFIILSILGLDIGEGINYRSLEYLVNNF